MTVHTESISLSQRSMKSNPQSKDPTPAKERGKEKIERSTIEVVVQPVDSVEETIK